MSGKVIRPTRREAHSLIAEQLSAMGFGKWNGYDGEKLMRITHAIAVFMAALTHSGQRFLWYCDNDAINEVGKRRNFKYTIEIFLWVLGMYTANNCDVGGFAKSFKEPTRLNDLLSLTDLAAGIVQDILQSEFKGKPTNGGKEKIEVMNWISRPSRFLSKLFLVFSEADDKAMLCKRVEITPKITAPD